MIDYTDPRQIEVNQAQGNPSIISNLAGASGAPQAPPPPPPQPAPSPTAAPSAAGASFPGGVIPQQVTQATTGLANTLYGSGFVKSADSAADAATKQLFLHDQMLNSNYSPFPTVQGFVDNPNSLMSASANYASGLGSLADMNFSASSNTERGYQAAITGLLDKFVNFYQMKQDEDNRKAERDRQDKKDRLDYEMAMADLTGGYVTDPYTGEKKYVKSKMQRDLESMTSGVGSSAGERDAARQKNMALGDIKNGMVPKDLFAKYAGTVDFNELMTMYNQHSTWGPAKESFPELRQMYDNISKGKYQNVDTGGGWAGRLSTLDGKTAADVSTYSSAVSQLNDLTGRLSSLAGSSPGFLKSLTEGTTGPIAGRLNLGTNEEKQLRSDIDTFKENVRKNLYGSVFTDTEKKEAILPGSKQQEQTNMLRLNSLLTQKKNELKYRLQTAGFSPQEADDYINSLNKNSSGGQNGDPLGLGI